ncbi:MAG: hypothetical protein WDA06_09130 [Phenylobacterium sp.]|jgi:hypothetical protein
MLMTDPHDLTGGPNRKAESAGEPANWTGAHADPTLAARFLYRWAGQFSAALVRIRSRFDGDLDQYLLYLVFVLQEISTASGNGRRRGLNALSLSEITQIPRETARRKLLTLAQAGYLRRDEEGLYYLGDAYGVDEVFDELKPLWDIVRQER